MREYTRHSSAAARTDGFSVCHDDLLLLFATRARCAPAKISPQPSAARLLDHQYDYAMTLIIKRKSARVRRCGVRACAMPCLLDFQQRLIDTTLVIRQRKCSAFDASRACACRTARCCFRVIEISRAHYCRYLPRARVAARSARRFQPLRARDG